MQRKPKNPLMTIYEQGGICPTCKGRSFQVDATVLSTTYVVFNDKGDWDAVDWTSEFKETGITSCRGCGEDFTYEQFWEREGEDSLKKNSICDIKCRHGLR
jgi:hypothetical protein